MRHHMANTAIWINRQKEKNINATVLNYTTCIFTSTTHHKSPSINQLLHFRFVFLPEEEPGNPGLLSWLFWLSIIFHPGYGAELGKGGASFLIRFVLLFPAGLPWQTFRAIHRNYTTEN